MESRIIHSKRGVRRRPSRYSAKQSQASVDENTSKELDIERDLRQLYIPDNYKSKALQIRISNPLFLIMIPNHNHKSVDDNS